MEKRLALSRLIICYFLCICLFLSAFYILISNTNTKEKTNIFSIGFKDDLLVFETVNTNEKTEVEEVVSTIQKEENITSTTSQNSVQTSTQAVKGKVIENQISPYSVSLSYNGVYIKNKTTHTINIKNLLSLPLSFKIQKNDQPQVLIIHTHTTETFLDTDAKTYGVNYTSRTTNNKKNMAAIGTIIAEKLNNAGIKTLHDKTQHDYPKYTGSYTRSAKTVNSYLQKYKSIKIVLDLHRDSVTVSGNDKAKLVTEINGKKAAQVMIVMGSQAAGAKNHPNWQENLKLAVKLQQVIETKYPKLARPLTLSTGKYNQSLSKGAMLMEFGTDMNSIDEAKYSAELVADCLISLLNTIK